MTVWWFDSVTLCLCYLVFFIYSTYYIMKQTSFVVQKDVSNTYANEFQLQQFGGNLL